MSYLKPSKAQLALKAEALKAELGEIQTWLSHGLSPNLRDELEASASALVSRIEELRDDMSRMSDRPEFCTFTYNNDRRYN